MTVVRSGLRCLALVLGAAVASGAGCASSTIDGGGSTCLSATSCPSQPPSYKTEVVPILTANCTVCHAPGGSAGFPMTTYADVAQEAGSMLSQVTVCQMPPLDGPVMTDADRTTLTGWLRCGAPDN